MNSNYGMIIGTKKKERIFKEIIRKLLIKKELTTQEKEFLEREGVLEPKIK